MYPTLLITKYLRTKLAPLFAALAVTLCTAMVILVISVMGGFLDMMRQSAKQITGDIVIDTPSLTGFPHYETIQDRLLAEPEFVAASPVIKSLGLFNGLGVTKGIQLIGIEPETYNQVVPYGSTLHWSAEDALKNYEQGFASVTENLADDAQARHDQRVAQIQSGFDLEKAGMAFTPPSHARLRGEAGSFYPAYRFAEIGRLDAMGVDLPPYQPEAKTLPGVVLGIEVSPDNRRDDQGQYAFENSRVDFPVNLTIVPLDGSGDLGVGAPVKSPFLIVNEFKSGLYEVDANTAFLSFERLQRTLKMEPTTISFDHETGDPIDPPIVVSGRCSQIVAKTAPGIDLAQAREKANWVIQQVRNEHPDLSVYVQATTWEEQHRQLLSAVQNEKGMITFLFAIISVVAVVMVATTFYMIVLEKTRDIGTLRAIGATAWGILNVFLGYGLTIGILGAAAGTALAWFIVNHLNELQAALAHRLGTLIFTACAVALLSLVTLGLLILVGKKKGNLIEWAVWPSVLVLVGLSALAYNGFPLIQIPFLETWNADHGFMMWDPKLYFFDRIPARIDWVETVPIAIGSVIASVIGAFIPALIAANLKPMEALRHE